MMREIKESDWKILRQLHSVALERFCEQILFEIEEIRSDSAVDRAACVLGDHQSIKRLATIRPGGGEVNRNPQRDSALVNGDGPFGG